MTIHCQATPCPIILSAQCVHYEGASLIYSGIQTNDTLEVALGKIDVLIKNDSASGIMQDHELTYDHSLISTALQSETDPVFSAWDKSTGISITESQISNLQSYVVVSTGDKSSAIDAGNFKDMSIGDDYLYICTQTGTAGNAIWKKTPLFKSL